MAFKKVFLIWLVITALAGGMFYLLKIMFRAHPHWLGAVPFLYIGVLILFVLYLLSVKGEKKAE
jgi:predicted membrane channel-forming protein YqfA (hemolysin III family)